MRQLAVTDADTAPDELEFELVEVPLHGTVLRVELGSQIQMVNGKHFCFFLPIVFFILRIHYFCLFIQLASPSGDTFTFNDITRNVLQYEHAGLTTEEDSMTFSVTDGLSMTSITVEVLVSEVKGDAPRRDPEALLSMEVVEKSSSIIRRSHLAYVVRHDMFRKSKKEKE